MDRPFFVDFDISAPPPQPPLSDICRDVILCMDDVLGMNVEDGANALIDAESANKRKIVLWIILMSFS